MGFEVDKMTLGQVFSDYFGFPSHIYWFSIQDVVATVTLRLRGLSTLTGFDAQTALEGFVVRTRGGAVIHGQHVADQFVVLQQENTRMGTS
jgi:hypothetical protein